MYTNQFSDKELRYRRRYLDLALNPDVQAVFRKRSAVVSAIREFLDARGFLEVETPVLQPLYGGASARPFVTHHNVLGHAAIPCGYPMNYTSSV